jgi:hypothetical protein
LVLDWREMAGLSVNGENRDGVMPTVRAVKKFPGRMHHNFGCAVAALDGFSAGNVETV